MEVLISLILRKTLAMAEILTTPNQMMVEWMPRHLAERYVRKGGKILHRKIKGFDKNMEPVFYYQVLYDKPRFTVVK